MRITAEDVIALSGVEIYLYVELVRVKSLGLRITEIVLPACAGRVRIERRVEQRLCYRVNGISNDIVRKRHVAVQRIVELVSPLRHTLDRNGVITEATRKPSRANIPEVACPLRTGKETRLPGGRRVIETLPLIVKEEEQLVLHDWATDSAAEHVPAQLISRRSIKSVFPGVRV